jgi:hypothetical protein
MSDEELLSSLKTEEGCEDYSAFRQRALFMEWDRVPEVHGCRRQQKKAQTT